LRAGNLIPWHRSNFFPSRYEAANTPKCRPFGSTKSGNFLNWLATTSFSRTLITKSYLVVHMSRLRRLVAAEAPVQSQSSSGGIYGGRSGTGTGFASSASVLSHQQRSTDAHTQSSVNGRVAAVPRDLNLTPTVTIDPPTKTLQRGEHKHPWWTVLSAVPYEMLRNLRIHNYVPHVPGNSNSSLFTHTHL
jgi:hypothetical protein